MTFGKRTNVKLGLYLCNMLKGVQRHLECEVGNLVTISGFNGWGMGAMPPNLTPNKFRESHLARLECQKTFE